MQIYLVGGAVRDRLLGLPVRERDWVVVGARPDELEALGYRRVGTSFPVFLHPTTGEEYALARTERKTGPGYRGFAVDAGPAITLEDDLQRRDLTMNAMAEDAAGRVIDPCGGQADLAARRLRHVSDAFTEDPVRILRVARFAARFAPLGFTVAAETMALMRQMVGAGEVAALVPERVWQETEAALGTTRPDVYVSVLRECGALAVIFPEVNALWGVPQPARWHPEIDTGVHLLMALQQAARLSGKPEIAFAVLVHDLGKGSTPPEAWPKHVGHEERGVELTLALSRRLGAPNRFRDLGCAVARCHGLCHRALELRAGTLLSLLERVDALRRPERFEDFLVACEADWRGRAGLADAPYEPARLLRQVLAAVQAISATDLPKQGLNGEAIGAALREQRTRAIAAVKSSFRPGS